MNGLVVFLGGKFFGDHWGIGKLIRGNAVGSIFVEKRDKKGNVFFFGSETTGTFKGKTSILTLCVRSAPFAMVMACGEVGRENLSRPILQLLNKPDPPPSHRALPSADARVFFFAHINIPPPCCHKSHNVPFAHANRRRVAAKTGASEERRVRRDVTKTFGTGPKKEGKFMRRETEKGKKKKNTYLTCRFVPKYLLSAGSIRLFSVPKSIVSFRHSHTQRTPPSLFVLRESI